MKEQLSSQQSKSKKEGNVRQVSNLLVYASNLMSLLELIQFETGI